jgi:hypothetical protein
MRTKFWVAAFSVCFLAGCGEGAESDDEADASDVDTDSDTDADTDTDTDSDTDSCDDLPPDGCVRLVSAANTAPGDGTTWCRAVQTVQAGIDAAAAALAADGSLTFCQVWVAAGTYSIYVSSMDDTLQLRPGVEVYGGFAGTEASLDERDWRAHPTTINGDNADGMDSTIWTITGSDGAIIDGFFVEGGFLNEDASPTITNCTFGGTVSNSQSAPLITGCTFDGMHSEPCILNWWASPTIRDSFFSQSGADLAQIQNKEASDTVVERCAFERSGPSEGGAIENTDSAIRISDSLFVGNTTSNGGGIVSKGEDSVVELTNSLFVGNAGGEGGAAVSAFGGTVSLNGVTIARSAVYELSNSVYLSSGAVATITDSILWDDSSSQIFVAEELSSVVVSYSDVMGGYDGTGVIDADPLFVGAAGWAGHHWSDVEYDLVANETVLTDDEASWTPGALAGLPILVDVDDTWAPWSWRIIRDNTATEIRIFGDTFYAGPAEYEIFDARLQPGSPCIDAADGTVAPEFDLDGDARVDDPATDNTGLGPPWADMGAYEYQP